MQLNFQRIWIKIRSYQEGNAVIPEGTCYLEDEYASHTKRGLDDGIVKLLFENRKQFHFIKNISQNTDYQILTSNDKVKLRKLNYQPIVKISFQRLMWTTRFEGKNYVLGQIWMMWSKLQVITKERNC
jgi:hypothetical protein